MTPEPSLRDPAPPPAVPVSGNLDYVAPDGRIVAWCWSPAEPDRRREVGVWIDGVEVLRARCDQMRRDLLGAGVGDGAHALDLPLPAGIMRPGCRVTVALRDVATGRQIGSATPVTWEGAPQDARPGPPSRVLSGNFDRVTKDGWVLGWCWYPDHPEVHVDLTVLVDDEAVGTTRAANFRPDLQAAGIGDGTHAFAFALPWSVMTDKGMLRVSVQETATMTALGDPILIRAGRLAAAEERIQDLVRQIRLLRGQIDDIAMQDRGRQEDRAARDLFATVAGFFQALADGDAGPVTGGGLRTAVESVTTRFAPLVLSIPEAPVATICVHAGASIDTVYRCLAALRDAGADRQADIVLLDDGAHGGEAALLPAVVRNLGYVRVPLQGSMLAARNDVAASGRGRLVAFLAPQVRVMPGWLEEIAGTFAREPDAAAVGSKVVRDDGLLHHTGILLGPDGTLCDPGRLAAADDPEHDFLRRAHALGDVAYALRRDLMQEAGGFGTGFASPAHATVDLCMRLRANARQVLYQPLAVAVWSDDSASDPAPVPDLSLPDEDSRRLRQRWVDHARPAPSTGTTGFIGHALVIDTAFPRPDHDAGSVATFEQMLLLRRLGYRVAFAASGDDENLPAEKAALRRNGIELASPPAYNSISSYLEAHGARLDLVHVYRHANATMFFDRVRARAPQAKLLFAPADLHHLREARAAELSGAPSLGPAGTREVELACIRASDATIITSDHELALLHDEVPPAKLKLLRWIAHVRPASRDFAARSGLCFLGSFSHPPNVDAVHWFTVEVLPRVLRALPGLRLSIAGADPPESIRALASANVEVLDWVADLDALFGQVRLSVAPLRYGAGFKGKVATSLAYGVPVVGTAIAVEGTGLAPGDGIALADDAAAFADEVVRLHEDEAVWTALAERGLERCRELYSPEAAAAVYRRLLADLGLPVSGT